MTKELNIYIIRYQSSILQKAFDLKRDGRIEDYYFVLRQASYTTLLEALDDDEYLSKQFAITETISEVCSYNTLSKILTGKSPVGLDTFCWLCSYVGPELTALVSEDEWEEILTKLIVRHGYVIGRESTRASLHGRRSATTIKSNKRKKGEQDDRD